MTTEEIIIDGKKAKVLVSINEILSGSVFEKKKVKIGAMEFDDVPVIKGNSTKFDFILGVDFLIRFVVTFNFKNKQIILEKN